MQADVILKEPPMGALPQGGGAGARACLPLDAPGNLLKNCQDEIL